MGEGTENYPYEIKDTDPEETAEIFKHFSRRLQRGFVRIGPKRYYFTKGMEEMAPKIYNMAVRPDDSWVLSYPKSGTTWMQELVWLVANDFDFERALAIPLVKRFPFLPTSTKKEGGTQFNPMSMNLMTDEAKALLPKDMDQKSYEALTKSVEHVSSLPSPRFIKSHLPLSLLPPTLLDTCRVVFVARDPRDVAVSYYHHTIGFKYMGYTGDFKNFWNLFIQDMINWTPFFANLKEVWENRNHPNLLFIFYGDMKKDLASVVRKVAKFYGKTVSEEQVSRACEHLSFDNFKKNKSVNMEALKEQKITEQNFSFVRKGNTGGWREMFDQEMTAQAERWIADNLRDSDLRFPSMAKRDFNI